MDELKNLKDEVKRLALHIRAGSWPDAYSCCDRLEDLLMELKSVISSEEAGERLR